MLVLSRRVGEELIIGEDVRIRVLRVEWIDGVATVRIGIDAPESIKVLRGELLQDGSAENIDDLNDDQIEVVEKPLRKKSTTRFYLRRKRDIGNF